MSGSAPALAARSAMASRRRVAYRSKRAAWMGRSRPLTMNLTPMIDVVFNLLFFFLAVTRFGTPEGTLPARLPGRAHAVAAAGVPRTPIRVRIDPGPAAEGGYRLTIDRFATEPFAFAALRDKLAEIQRRPGYDDRTPVHIISDDSVAWDHVTNAYNSAVATEYRKIYLIAAESDGR